MWLLFILVYSIVICFALGALSLAPWLPSSKHELDRALALLAVRKGDVLYDLGSGDGRIVFAASQLGADARGIELALPLVLVCWLRSRLRKSTARFYWGNFLKRDISDANAVYVFGRPSTNKHLLRKKLEASLRSGSRVVSYAFPIEGWDAEVVDKPSPKAMVLYLYRR